VFSKWGLDAVEIGRVTDDDKLRVLDHGRVVAEIPAHAIAEEGPRYERPIAAPASPAGASGPLFEFASGGADLTENFRELLASPAIASKYWITEQYDSMVRTNTRFGPGASDAAVLRLKETERGLALSTDGNGRWCFLSPRVGAMHAVAESARNVACSGAHPVAATNCLNFGNPEKAEVMWQFSEAVDGIAEACRALEIPITGGNVSFYNETLGKPIYPTPILGVLGVLEDADFAVGSAFDKEGDAIVLLDGAGAAAARAGDSRAEFSSSEYAKTTQGIVGGAPPAIDLAAEKRLIECLVSLASAGLILSAHDVSDGGVAVTIAESCFASDGLSAEVNLTGAVSQELASGTTDEERVFDVSSPPCYAGEIESARDNRALAAEPAEVALFGERGARAVVSLSAASLAQLNAVAAQYGVAANRIGTVTRSEFRIQFNGTPVIRGDVSSFRKAWSESLAAAIESA
jgi:phosphoribosylformylglycinamidine synthase